MILTPYPAPARKYEVYPRFCRFIRRTMSETLGFGCLDETTLLFDNTGMDWGCLRGLQSIFVRPLIVEGVPPPILLMPWLLVPADIFAQINTDFEPALAAVGARSKLGNAENLIFLAQLTPVR